MKFRKFNLWWSSARSSQECDLLGGGDPPVLTKGNLQGTEPVNILNHYAPETQKDVPLSTCRVHFPLKPRELRIHGSELQMIGGCLQDSHPHSPKSRLSTQNHSLYKSGGGWRGRARWHLSGRGQTWSLPNSGSLCASPSRPFKLTSLLQPFKSRHLPSQQSRKEGNGGGGDAPLPVPPPGSNFPAPPGSR